ncbi:MAG: helicase-related protein [Promethearchaeota archaeon]
MIQNRQYQQIILSKLKENFLQGRHTVVEVDTGLGKRVLAFLLIKDLSEQRILILLHSTISYSETIHYFQEEYGGFHDSEFQAFSSKTSGQLRHKILNEARIVAATPQTFANVFNKLLESKKPRFNVVIINEIDKIVRRYGGSRLLIFPYNSLIPYFIRSGAWIVGMTGTIRDSHILYNHLKDQIEIQPEIDSLDKRIPKLHIIRMDTLLAQTDIKNYIQNTYIQRYEVKISPELLKILNLIDQGIQELRKEIIEETLEQHPTLLETIPSSQLALVSGMLESGNTQKYQGLLLVRKYCTAMQPPKFRKFLFRLTKFGITKDLIYDLPEHNAKIDAVLDLIKKQSQNSKTVVLCSFLDTAQKLQEEIQELGLSTFKITGQVRNKIAILNHFKESENKAVLVMTSVGERDIDIPQSNLLIVYDVVNTVKTMYQRFKRTRGGLVLCLCYGKTFEEQKIGRLFQEIRKRYPWSSIIE